MNRKPNKPKTTKTVYVDPVLWDAVLAKGINISGSLNDLLQELAAPKQCPACGQKIKKDKK